MIGGLLALTSAFLAHAVVAAAQPPGSATPPCRATEISRNLDFWVGDWDVYVGSELNGRDTVERLLGGCAIVERWHGGAGDEGMSLFAYDARKDLWTQNWITENSALPGGIKVKLLRAHTPTSTTFEGEIEGKTGAVYYDRTILTALPGGRVHQEIQVSRNGVAWRTGFDAIYVRHGERL
ncbi:MAG: hypothetical protein ACJ8FT_11145 [Sphingomonas sp.]